MKVCHVVNRVWLVTRQPTTVLEKKGRVEFCETFLLCLAQFIGRERDGGILARPMLFRGRCRYLSIVSPALTRRRPRLFVETQQQHGPRIDCSIS